MNRPLFKSLIFSLALEPIFYICALVTVFYASSMFFFVNRFFVIQNSSTDMRIFFNSIVQISVLTVPLLTFALKKFIYEDSIPVCPTARFFTLSISIWLSCMSFILLMIFVPVSVNFFGKVDFAQIFASFFFTALVLFCSVCFTLFVFSFVNKNSALSALIVSVIVLAALNFIHLIPLYVKIGDFFASLIQSISFSWHSDSALKGIIDSRDIVFFIGSSAIFLFLAVFFEYKRTERRINFLHAFLLSASVFFLIFSLQRMYFRIDVTSSRQFSLSKTTAELCHNLENPLRITYFRSKELKQFYPQSEDVAEFLKAYVARTKNVYVSFENADPQKLSRLGIQGQQIKTENTTKVEYTTVYSAIFLQYLDKSSIIPFAFSTQSLEYDISQRVQSLLTGKTRPLYIISGNGRSVEQDYSYVVPWFASRGFVPSVVEEEKITSFIENLSAEQKNDCAFVVLGSKNLSYEQSDSIKNACAEGIPFLIFTNPYTADIENDWNVTKNDFDSLIPVLNGMGFAFDFSLAQDISNFPITMQSTEQNSTEYKTVNYPLWISVLPQKQAFEGVTFFWASPISCYSGASPLLVTSEYAWKQNASSDKSSPFIVNPFLIGQTALSSQARTETLTLAAIKENVAVVSDQYFLSSLMTGVISQSDQADFRNFDYASSILLELKGEGDLALLMRKSRPVKSLYKITNQDELIKAVKRTIAINFIVIPIFILLIGILFALGRYLFYRKMMNEKKCFD